MTKKSILLILLLGMSISFYANQYSGVKFNTKMPKTEIALFDDSELLLPALFEINFSMYLTQPLSIGQVLMFKIDESIYSLTYIGRNLSDCKFVLSLKSNKLTYIDIPFDALKAVEENWFNISIVISTEKRIISIQIDKKKYTLSNLILRSGSKFKLTFGPNEWGLSDVPPMAISNLIIKDSGKPKFVFPFNESVGNIAQDTISDTKAKLVNPVWLINTHHFWKHIASLNISKAAGVTYDTKRSKLLILNSDNLVSWSFKENKKSTLPLKGRKIIEFSGEAVYSSTQDLILYYNLFDGDGITTPFFAKVNTNGEIVSFKVFEFHNPLHHHALIWDEYNQKIGIFGGYGNYSYSDKLLLFNEKQLKWDSIITNTDRITPRMHTIAGPGPEQGLFYIYGGIGNETGKQELGKEFYSDLYLLNLKNKKINKLWSDSGSLSYLIPKRNLIYDPISKSVLFLCTNRTNGKIGLYSFDVNTGLHQRVSNETLVNTNCISSTAYLFYDKILQKYCMAIRQAEDNSDIAKMEIYTLNYPAIAYAQLKKTNEDISVFQILIPLLIIITILVTLLIYRYTKKRKMIKINVSENITSDIEEINLISPDKRFNAVYLFGEFEVINRDGVNISARFSSKIKQIFTLILLNTLRYNEGVSTEKLSLTVWANKDLSDAKNIRGVTINHLRSILKELDGISLIYAEDKWTISLTDECYCDYKSAISLQKKSCNLESTKELLNILKRGSLLPAFYQYQWFEKIKIEFDELLFVQLEEGISLLVANKLWNDAVIAANALFSFDHLNEIALKYKIQALSKLRKPENAEILYDKFCKEYQICYNEKYKLKFSELLQ